MGIPADTLVVDDVVIHFQISSGDLRNHSDAAVPPGAGRLVPFHALVAARECGVLCRRTAAECSVRLATVATRFGLYVVKSGGDNDGQAFEITRCRDCGEIIDVCI